MISPSAEIYMPHFTSWVINHPIEALVIAFFVAFSESIIIIGSFIPGVVTMTILGMLAGAGYISIYQAILVTILGSIVGDCFSFYLGYKYSKQLTNSWLLSKRPHWIQYGKSFFEKNGGKSVLLGRFIGPLRSLIPVIAGMMKMRPTLFVIINSFASSLWTLAYILPGIILGVASNELSPQEARHAAFLFVISLGVIWLLWIILKWVITKLILIINYFLNHYLRQLSKHPIMTMILQKLCHNSRAQYLYTTQLLFSSVLLICIIMYLVYSVQNQTGIYLLNDPIFSVLQSLRSTSVDIFLISINELSNREALTFVWLSICFIITIKKNWRLLGYWISLYSTASIITLIFQYFILSLHPVTIRHTISGNSFPNYSIMLLVIMMGALRSAILSQYNHFIAGRFNQYTYLFLLIIGLIPIFLGTNWLTDILGSYAIGTLLLNIHTLVFKPHLFRQKIHTKWIIIFIITTMSLLGIQHLNSRFHEIRLKHQQQFNYYEISQIQWWNQRVSILPIYRTNRLGKTEERFNIQYLGNLNHLMRNLELNGWNIHHEPIFQLILKKLSGNKKYISTPVLTKLYLNRKPELVMILPITQNGSVYLLKLWFSNYKNSNNKKPIWLGNITKIINNKSYYPNLDNKLSKWINNETFTIKIKKIYSKKTKDSWPIFLLEENNGK